MKKLIFTMLIALFSILSFNEAIATCPSGYSSYTITKVIGDCIYEISGCFQCNIAYPSNLILAGYKKLGNCNNSMNESEVQQKIKDVISDVRFIDSLCGLPGPCNTGAARVIKEKIPICWYATSNNDNITYIPCNPDNCYCELTITYCWNGTEYTKSISYSMYCSNPWILCPLPVPPQFPDNGFPTECYNFSLECY